MSFLISIICFINTLWTGIREIQIRITAMNEECGVKHLINPDDLPTTHFYV